MQQTIVYTHTNLQLRGEPQEAVRCLNTCSAIATAHGDTAGAIRDCMLAATAKLLSGDASAAVVALTAQATAAQSASLTSVEVSYCYNIATPHTCFAYS
jgi:hypothetical protein